MNGRTVLTLLLYLWIAITAAMVLMWLFRRRPDSDRDSRDTVVLGAPDPEDGESADEDQEDRHLVSSPLGVGLSSPSEPETGESVAELLADIELPYDLRPVHATDAGRRALYLSPHPDPEDIGTEFADELVKLGYSIEPMSIDEAVARRGHDVLHMKIVPEAGTVVADDGVSKPYDQASPTDTALEIWIDGETDSSVRW